MPQDSADPNQPTQRLRREVGVFGAMMMGLGSIIGTGIFVGLGDAAEVAGPWVIVAIAVAALVACLNGLSSAQLAAAHPVSGGTYEYGYRWLHPTLGFTAGWMFLCAKSASAATAALGFSAYGLRLLGLNAPTMQMPIAIAVVAIVTICLLGGMRWSNAFNAVVVSVTLLTLMLFITAGAATVFQSDDQAASIGESTRSDFAANLPGFLEACALMFVAYTGYGRIATLGEEIREPKRNIPIAIMTTLMISMTLYVAVAWVSVQLPEQRSDVSETSTLTAPLEAVAQQFTVPHVHQVIALGAVTSMLGVLINLVLGLSRVVLAMGRRGDLPKPFARLDQSGRTAPAAVIGVGVLIGALVSIGNVKTTWSFSAFTVLIYYAITNLAAIRMSDAERRYPRCLGWLGLISCLGLAFWVEPQAWAWGLGIIALGFCGKAVIASAQA